MVERGSFHIRHKDGTLTIIASKHQSFRALKSPSRQVSEADIEGKIKQASLPFKDKVETILGWGGFSVAARLERSLPPESPNRVVVFRPMAVEDGLKVNEEISSSWRDEQIVNKQFAPFTISQHLVIADGIDGMPAALKVAKEVEGATLKDFSLLAILSNPSFLEQYVQFCQKALGIFASERKLVDTSGHLAVNKLKQLWIGMIPFYSDNLMVEYGSNKLVFVDCDVKPAIHFFQKANWSQKIGMTIRAGFIGVTAVAAKTFILAHQIRNRFFEEKYTESKKERGRRSEEYQNFTGGFQEIVQALNDAGLDYRIIGSVGMAGTIQSAGGEFYLTPRRVNRTRRDVDIIVLDPWSEKIEELGCYLSRRSKSIKGYPDIALVEPVRIGEVKPKIRYPHERILPTEISKPGIDQDGNIYQVYRDLSFQINKNHLRPVMVEYEGVQFPTVSPGVLAGFALTRGGNFKPKDLRKIGNLFIHTRFRIPTEFRDFAQAIRQNYPELYNNFLIREWLSYWTGGFISGGQITRFVRDRKPFFVKKNGLPSEALAEDGDPGGIRTP